MEVVKKQTAADRALHHKSPRPHVGRQLSGSGATSPQIKNEKSFNYNDTVSKLTFYYKIVKRQLMRHQSATTGLFPRIGGSGTLPISYARDSIYCAASIWALSQAFKRIDDDRGKTHELSQAAVKCMRGILAGWMRQSERVENFKVTQSPKHALHCVFHLHTGDEVFQEDQYNHLQVDVIALYLIFLVQMIQSGLQIIFTHDEVTFVQNLVFYIERSYRTPDYGMWERGSKYHIGESELHASSIGHTKAALEAVNGCNLYGLNGSSGSTLFIDIDAHFRNRATIDNMLPRESVSKNTDASLLPTVSWPAFAIHEEHLINKTMSKIIRKLKGRHGFKRFLRDGYKTAVEDTSSRHYEAWEIKLFDNVECEWPMFFAFMLIDSIFRQDKEKAEYWQEQLMSQLVKTADGPVLPQFYYIPEIYVSDERNKPGTQDRLPSPEVTQGRVFLWGQAVFIISQLLSENLVSSIDLDPIRRYLPAADRPRMSERYSSFQRGSTSQSSPSDLVIQVVLISESIRLQQMLSTYGIQTQTPHQVEPVQIWPPSMLVKAYEHLGVNKKMKLTGRPSRPIGGLGTAKIYRTCGITFVSYPLLFEVQDFYTSLDMEFVIDDIKSDLQFLSKCWKLAGRPTFCMIIREENLKGANARHIFELLAQFKRGDCDGIKIRLGRLQEFLSSACMEHLDFLTSEKLADMKDFHQFKERDVYQEFRSLTDIPSATQVNKHKEDWKDVTKYQSWSTQQLCSKLEEARDYYLTCQLLEIVNEREGLLTWVSDDGTTVKEMMEDVHRRAASDNCWAVTRRLASRLQKVVDSLAPSITTILVRGKQVSVGICGKTEETFDKPTSPQHITNMLYRLCYDLDPTQAVLQQEMIINIGKLCTTDPELFEGILRIRIGWLIEAMKMELMYTQNDPRSLYAMSPKAIKSLLIQTLTKHEAGHDHKTVLWNRQLEGALNRTPLGFFDRVWEVLKRCPAGIKVGAVFIPQQPTLSDMTQYELRFSLIVDQMLSQITDVAFKQMLVEGFMVVAAILERNKELSFNKVVNMDVLVHEAFDLFYINRNPDQPAPTKEFKESNPDVMIDFYGTVPNVHKGTTSFIAKAVMNTILDGEFQGISETQCIVS